MGSKKSSFLTITQKDKKTLKTEKLSFIRVQKKHFQFSENSRSN